MESVASQSTLSDLAKLFLKLGLIGFGGPAVHIAMMEDEVVRKRKWLSQEHFLDLVGATNLIPGPNSTEMTMHIGYERAGWKGLVVAGVCFIVPAVLITGVFAWTYAAYGTLPQVSPFLYGVKPAIIAVIVSLMITLGSKALKSVELGIIGAVAAILALAGFNQVYILFGAGFIGVLLHWVQQRSIHMRCFAPALLLQFNMLAADTSSSNLFWIFLKVGSILYGSGYVLFAFLDAELVTTGLLTTQELVDAIAVGQITPGPVFSSATFVGWQIGGWTGALAATLGIFLPSFLFVALLNPLIPRLRKSKSMAAFLDTVNIVSVALILSICVEMGRESIADWRSALIALAGFVLLICFKKLNSAFIVLGGAAMGYLLWLV